MNNTKNYTKTVTQFSEDMYQQAKQEFLTNYQKFGDLSGFQTDYDNSLVRQFEDWNNFTIKTENLRKYENCTEFIYNHFNSVVQEFKTSINPKIESEEDKLLLRNAIVRRLYNIYQSMMLEDLQQLAVANYLKSRGIQFTSYSSRKLDRLGIDFCFLVKNKKNGMINFYNFHTTNTSNDNFLNLKKSRSVALSNNQTFYRNLEFNDFSHYNLKIYKSFNYSNNFYGQQEQKIENIENQIVEIFNQVNNLDARNGKCDTLKMIKIASENMGNDHFEVLENNWK